MRSPPCGCAVKILGQFEVIKITVDENSWARIEPCSKHAAVDELIEALLDYGRHLETCLADLGKPCRCGFDEFLQKVSVLTAQRREEKE